MRRFPKIAAAVILLLPLFCNGAEPVDPLWMKTVTQFTNMKVWTAQDIDLVLEQKNGNEAPKITKGKSHLLKWESGKAVYKTQQTDPKPKDGAEFDSPDLTEFVKNSDKLISPNSTVLRKDGALLDGKSWTMFTLSKSKLNGNFVLKLWVDPETGCPNQSELHVHMSLMMDIVITTSYQPQPSIQCLPKQTEFQFEILVPFQNSKARMIQTPLNWIEHPA